MGLPRSQCSHAIPRITELPQDILLELAKYLDVADLLSFLSVCRSLRDLQSHGILWITALTRIREIEKQPLPISSAQALTRLSLPELQNAARKANGVMMNFRSHNPRPARVRTSFVEAGHQHSFPTIFCIPGADIVIISTRTGGVSCWDLLTSQRVAHLELPSFYIETVRACLEIEGKALIGGSTYAADLDLECLVVICIDFRNREHISIYHVVSPVINHSYSFRTHPFITPQLMGFCAEGNLMTWAMDAGVSMKGLDIDDYAQTEFLSFGQNLYVFCWNHGTSATIRTVPLPTTSERSTLASDGATSFVNTSTTVTVPYPSGFSSAELQAGGYPLTTVHGEHLFAPHFGIAAVTSTKFIIREKGIRADFIHFWTGHITSSGTIEFGQCFLYQHPDPIYQIAVGTSGTYVLVLVEQNPSYFGLVHFSATPTPHTSFRKLDIGDFSVSTCARIALDESMGLVITVDDDGTWTIFSCI
ncbi:hypothetical protein DFH06DRAFT_459542 [Mycena polygramma]|nr:hypothetical protein DFH06DRAFT_459542 [Mycena polygramma]